jgi:hypothetical protein
MGTFFTNGASKMDIVEELKAEYGDRLLDSHLHDDEFWTVVQLRNKPETIIVVHLLVPARDGWGYKPIDECMGPYYYGCPMEWLDKYPTTDESALAWRQKCREENTQV